MASSARMMSRELAHIAIDDTRSPNSARFSRGGRSKGALTLGRDSENAVRQPIENTSSLRMHAFSRIYRLADVVPREVTDLDRAAAI